MPKNPSAAEVDAFRARLCAVPLWLDIAASIGAFVGAVWFTRCYPAAVRNGGSRMPPLRERSLARTRARQEPQ